MTILVQRSVNFAKDKTSPVRKLIAHKQCLTDDSDKSDDESYDIEIIKDDNGTKIPPYNTFVKYCDALGKCYLLINHMLARDEKKDTMHHPTT